MNHTKERLTVAVLGPRDKFFHIPGVVAYVGVRGLPKLTFWAVAEAVAEDRKISATVAEAVAEAEGSFFNKSLVGYQFAE